MIQFVNFGDNSCCSYYDNLYPVFHMLNEHYSFNSTWVDINLNIMYSKNLKRGVYYNLEHVFPMEYYRERCTKQFYESVMPAYNTFDFILDFQIENFEFFNHNDMGHKFRFAPLRYTSLFKKYDIPSYENRIYDLQFECKLDTDIRKDIFNKLTMSQCEISSLVPYTYNIDYSQKIKTKTMGKYGIDFPHYDKAETINTFRIWEYACLNMPVILIDPYNITSTKYFEKNIVKTLGTDFNPEEIKSICSTYYDYSGENSFEKLTYSDTDYDNYRLSIIKDYCDRTHNTIPDYVMYDDWHD